MHRCDDVISGTEVCLDGLLWNYKSSTLGTEVACLSSHWRSAPRTDLRRRDGAFPSAEKPLLDGPSGQGRGPTPARQEPSRPGSLVAVRGGRPKRAAYPWVVHSLWIVPRSGATLSKSRTARPTSRPPDNPELLERRGTAGETRFRGGCGDRHTSPCAGVRSRPLGLDPAWRMIRPDAAGCCDPPRDHDLEGHRPACCPFPPQSDRCAGGFAGSFLTHPLIGGTGPASLRVRGVALNARRPPFPGYPQCACLRQTRSCLTCLAARPTPHPQGAPERRVFTVSKSQGVHSPSILLRRPGPRALWSAPLPAGAGSQDPAEQAQSRTRGTTNTRPHQRPVAQSTMTAIVI